MTQTPDNFHPRCNHGPESFDLRLKVTSNGVKQFKFQCQICGEKGTTIGHRNQIVSSLSSDPPLLDEEVRRQFILGEMANRSAEIRDAQNERNRAYREYLLSDKWRQKRLLVLARDEFRCQAAMNGCLIKASQVHHLTYERVFNEPLFDLVAICGSCHRAIHGVNAPELPRVAA